MKMRWSATEFQSTLRFSLISTSANGLTTPIFSGLAKILAIASPYLYDIRTPLIDPRSEPSTSSYHRTQGRTATCSGYLSHVHAHRSLQPTPIASLPPPTYLAPAPWTHLARLVSAQLDRGYSLRRCRSFHFGEKPQPWMLRESRSSTHLNGGQRSRRPRYCSHL